MAGSRTVRTLTALLVAMTLGAFVLMLLETAPLRPSASYLAAVAPSPGSDEAIFETDVPLQPLKWRNIVVHSSASAHSGLAERTHFVIGPGADAASPVIRATPLWKRQAEGHHVYVPWRDFNADSVGICLVGDFSRRGPTEAQLRVLIRLVQALQRTFRIAADRVYLHSDLDPGSGSPGRAFPGEAFTERLLHATR